jgi:HAD superfamily hydrolase (TIGR01509 family)
VALRAIVFDFDGVIANTEPLHFEAYRGVLAPHGIALSETEYYARYLGYDDVGAFRAIGADCGHAFDLRTIERLVEEKAVRLEALERASPVLFPGAADAVRRLAARFPLAIASGALRAEIERVLAATALARFFEGIVAAEDTPLSKPAPDPYRRALDLLRRRTPDLRSAECVAVEDSRWGLESARAAGLRTVAVTHTYRAELLAPSADLVVASLETLHADALTRAFGGPASCSG